MRHGGLRMERLNMDSRCRLIAVTDAAAVIGALRSPLGPPFVPLAPLHLLLDPTAAAASGNCPQ